MKGREPKAIPLGRTNPRTIQGAFTLMELLVVMSIIGLLAAISMPAIKGFNQADIMKSAARQLLDDVNLARMKAISERSTVYMVFIPPTVVDAQLLNRLTGLPASALKDRALRQWTNAVQGQYTTYALFIERSVGDQFGQPNPRYITDWKALPEGVFIPTIKYVKTNTTAWINSVPRVRPFAYGKTFPFPNRRIRDGSGNSIEWELPYLAFNSRGQIVHPDPAYSPLPDRQDECIPVARGSVFYPRNGTQFLAADAQELPPGNSTNAFNRIYINWMTGRARIETPGLQ